jgi:threonine dehydrogenase-like Zn-dependent dehydrogenase
MPRAGEVRVRVVATGVCGSDLRGYTGENGRRSPGQIMGHEMYGLIEAAGDLGTEVSLLLGTAVTTTMAAGEYPAGKVLLST